MVDDPRADRFEILLDEEPAGFVTYTRARAGLSLLHTEIDPRFEGRGLGAALALPGARRVAAYSHPHE
ncbi:N-acetyltransferase [Planomonospora sp. ID91781]|nr:N-acetyltransferase [Planomonospora sp. ID91781]